MIFKIFDPLPIPSSSLGTFFDVYNGDIVLKCQRLNRLASSEFVFYKCFRCTDPSRLSVVIFTTNISVTVLFY